MNNSLMLLLIVVFVGLMLLIFLIMYGMSHKKKPMNSTQIRKQRAVRISSYLKWYRDLDSFVLTRQFLRLIYNNLAELAIYNDIDLRIESLKLFVMAEVVYIGVIIAAAFVFKDLIITVIFVGFATVFRDVVITKRVDKIHYKMLLEEADILSELRQEYLRVNEIPEALASIQPGKYIKHSIDDIYMILTSDNAQERLEDFYKACPLKTVQTLAGVCYTINNSGEPETDDGTSVFVQALGMITNEVNLEIRRLRLLRAQFGALEWFPLVPVLALRPIRSFFVDSIPGTATIYDGTSGYWFLVICLSASLFSYKMIMQVTRPVAVKYDDRTQFDKDMVHKRWVRALAAMLRPNKDKSLKKIYNRLKNAQSRLDLTYIYWRKFYFSLATFLIILVVAAFSTYVGYQNTWNSVQSGGIVSDSMTEDEAEILRAMDSEYFKSPHEYRDNMEQFVKKNTKGLSNSEIQRQVERLQAKEEALENSVFHWWFILLAAGAGWIAWFVPDILIGLRTFLIKSEAEEDCLQLQTIIGIMMNTSIDTLDLLDWLSKHSRVFRPLLIDAYHAYPGNPEASLNKLKMSAGLVDFKRLVDKLMLTIHQISIAEAFSDIILERDHLLRMREIAQQESIMSKRQQMSMVALLPLMFTIMLYFIAPVGLLGANEITDLLENLDQITG